MSKPGSGSFCDGAYRRVRDLAFDTDGVEMDRDAVEIADGKQLIMSFKVFQDRGRYRSQPDAFSGEELQQSGIFDFRDNVRAEVLAIEPFLHRSAKHCVLGWKEQWLSVKRIRIIVAQTLSHSCCGDPGDAGFPESMIVGFDADLRASGAVGKYKVSLVYGKICKQLGKLAFVADELDFFRHAKDGFQQSKGYLFGQEVWDADGEGEGTIGLGTFQTLHEFLAGSKDLFGVLEDDSTDFSEPEFSAVALVEFAANGLFKLPELTADGGLREVQFGSGTADAAFACHGPEVKQVVVVEPIHGRVPLALGCGGVTRRCAEEIFIQTVPCALSERSPEHIRIYRVNIRGFPWGD